MNVDKVYVADICVVYNKKVLDFGVEDVHAHYLKTTIVYKKPNGSENIFIDLLNKEKYDSKLNNVGDCCVNLRTMEPLKLFLNDTNKRHMLKKTLVKEYLPMLDSITKRKKVVN